MSDASTIDCFGAAERERLACKVACVTPIDEQTAGDVIYALGRALHQAGIATDVTEDTLRDVAQHLGVVVQVNILPTSMTIAVGPPTNQHLTIVRLEPGRLNLRKVAGLNDIILAIRDGSADAVMALTRISTVDAVDAPTAWWLVMVGYVLLSAGAAMLLGGGMGEITLAAATGVAVGLIAALARLRPSIDRLFEVAAAFTATALVVLWERFVGGVALYVAVVAGIVQLLPGYTLTTALAELANGQLVAGTARLGSVLITLLSLASGFALGLSLGGPTLFSGETLAPSHNALAFTLLAAPLMATALAIILHARPRDFGWILGAASLAIGLQRFFPTFGFTQITPFLTAFVLGVLGNTAARLWRIPESLILVPGLFVLVPGSISYQSILYIFQADAGDAITLALRAAIAAVLIVSGFLLAGVIMPASRDERDHRAMGR